MGRYALLHRFLETGIEMDIGVLQMAFLMGIFFFGYFEQQISGFGASLFCLPFALLILPRTVFVPVALIYTLLQAAFIAVRSRRVMRWKTLFLVLALAGIVGIPVADYLLAYVTERSLKVGLALFIAVYSLCELWSARGGGGGKKTGGGLLDLVLPVGSGAMQAAYGVGGPLLMAYLSKHIHEKMALRATVCGYWVVLNSVILIKYLRDGWIGEEVLQLTAWLAPAVILGSFLGSKVIHKISQEKFKQFIYMLLILSACFLLL